VEDKLYELKIRCKKSGKTLKEVYTFTKNQTKSKMSYKSFIKFVKTGDLKIERIINSFLMEEKIIFRAGEVLKKMRLKKNIKRIDENFSEYKQRKVENAKKIEEISPEILILYSEALNIPLKDLKNEIKKEQKDGE
jgi:hypothetical protein